MKACVNILTVLFLLTSCANIVAPTGGDQDMSAPRLLNVEFLQATNDKKTKTIIFEFRTIYIVFEDPSTESEHSRILILKLEDLAVIILGSRESGFG